MWNRRTFICLCSIVLATTALPVAGLSFTYAQEGVKKSRRPAVAVFITSPSEDDAKGRVEKCVSDSKAFRLFSRDTLGNLVNEVKLSEEGILADKSRKQLGQVEGLDYVIACKYKVEKIVHKQPALNGSLLGNSGLLGRLNKPTETSIHESHVTVVCSLTNLVTGERKSFVIDKNALNDVKAKDSADSEVIKHLKALTPQLIGSLVQAKPEYLRIDIGEDDGVVVGMLFDLVETVDAGDGYTDKKKIGVCRVTELYANNAKLEVGQLDQKRWKSNSDLSKRIIADFSTGKKYTVEEQKQP